MVVMSFSNSWRVGTDAHQTGLLPYRTKQYQVSISSSAKPTSFLIGSPPYGSVKRAILQFPPSAT